MSNDIEERIAFIVSTIKRIPIKMVEEHAEEPVNGDFFRFEAIDLVYFIAELMKEFQIQLDNQELKICSWWNIREFCQSIADHLGIIQIGV